MKYEMFRLSKKHFIKISFNRKLNNMFFSPKLTFLNPKKSSIRVLREKNDALLTSSLIAGFMENTWHTIPG